MHTSTESELTMCLIDAIEELSSASRIIERWPVYIPPDGDKTQEKIQQHVDAYERTIEKGKQRLTEHFKRFLRKNKRLQELLPELENFDLPTDLLSHIDCNLSPNTWLLSLCHDVEYLNALVRGEAMCIASISSALEYFAQFTEFIRHKTNKGYTTSIPDFSMVNASSVMLRPPVIMNETKPDLDILDMLKTLNYAAAPVKLEYHKLLNEHT